jgi:hypothetical protein
MLDNYLFHYPIPVEIILMTKSPTADKKSTAEKQPTRGIEL